MADIKAVSKLHAIFFNALINIAYLLYRVASREIRLMLRAL